MFLGFVVPKMSFELVAGQRLPVDILDPIIWWLNTSVNIFQSTWIWIEEERCTRGKLGWASRDLLHGPLWGNPKGEKGEKGRKCSPSGPLGNWLFIPPHCCSPLGEPILRRWQHNLSSSQRTRTEWVYVPGLGIKKQKPIIILVCVFSVLIIILDRNLSLIFQQVGPYDHRAESSREWPMNLGAYKYSLGIDFQNYKWCE